MKFETFDNLRLPKIGFGTGRLGGSQWPNRWRDGHWLAAIRSALVFQPRVVAIPMSFNPIHQKENLAAADIQLSESEMDQLNKVA